MPAEKQSFGEGHRDEVNRAKRARITTRTSYIHCKRLNYAAEGSMIDENESPDSHKSGDFDAHLPEWESWQDEVKQLEWGFGEACKGARRPKKHIRRSYLIV
jgi:hypothetical protein